MQTGHRNKLLSYIVFVLGVAILTGAVLYYLNINQIVYNDTEDLAPDMISGVPRTDIIAGSEAVESIQQLHGTQIYIVDGVVAVYGSQNLILWVSDAGDHQAATELTDLMKVRIGEGRSPFVESGSYEINGFSVYKLEGLGQIHYYWHTGNLVVWLAADEQLAETALQESVDFYR